MLELILKSFYLALPAYFANMAPVIFSHLGWFKFLSKPIDGGRKIGQEKIFGENKTWRGIASAVILSLLITAIQAGLYHFDFFKSISLFNYPQAFLLFGILSGLGSILGDLLKSFFKRRFGFKTGSSWPVFDQIDFIVGFFLFVYWIFHPAPEVIVAVFALTLILHPLINISAYLLKIKKVWW